MGREGDLDGRKGRRLVFKARKAHAGRGRWQGDVKRRQRLDEGLVLLAFVAKRRVVGRAEHGDVRDRVREIPGGRYAGFRIRRLYVDSCR
jgi:hypothetical protein